MMSPRDEGQRARRPGTHPPTAAGTETRAPGSGPILPPGTRAVHRLDELDRLAWKLEAEAATLRARVGQLRTDLRNLAGEARDRWTMNRIEKGGRHD